MPEDTQQAQPNNPQADGGNMPQGTQPLEREIRQPEPQHPETPTPAPKAANGPQTQQQPNAKTETQGPQQEPPTTQTINTTTEEPDEPLPPAPETPAVSGGASNTPNTPTPSATGSLKSKIPFIAIAILGLLLVVGGGAAYYFLIYQPKSTETLEQPVTVETPPATEAVVQESTGTDDTTLDEDQYIKSFEEANEETDINEIGKNLEELDFEGIVTDLQELEF